MHSKDSGSTCRRSRAALADRCASVLIALIVSGVMLAISTASAEDVGTLVEFEPETKALASEVNQNFDDLKTAVNSKSSTGFEFSSSDTAVQISDSSGSPTVVSEVTVTAPGPGFIRVDFSAYLTIGHTQDAGNSYVVCAIKTNTTSPDSATGRVQGTRRFIPILTDEFTGVHYPHADTLGVHEVAAAGSVVLSTVCYRNAGSTAGTAFYRTMTATFFDERL